MKSVVKSLSTMAIIIGSLCLGMLILKKTKQQVEKSVDFLASRTVSASY